MPARLTNEQRSKALEIVAREYPKGTPIIDIASMAGVSRNFVFEAKKILNLEHRKPSAFDEANPNVKRCRRCDQWKSIEEFGVDRGRRSGRRCYCVRCEKAYFHESRVKDRSMWLYHSTLKSARERHLTHTIRPEDIIIPSHCPVLGIPLYFTPEHRTDNSPSVDRVDNSRGYEPDNIMVISFRANFLRANATLAELKALALFYERLSISSEAP